MRVPFLATLHLTIILSITDTRQRYDDRETYQLQEDIRKPAWIETASPRGPCAGNRPGLAIPEVVCVDLDILFFVRGNRTLFKDRAYRTRRLTGAAVNTLIRINEELLHIFVVAFALGRMNAIHRTDIDTRAIFNGPHMG